MALTREERDDKVLASFVSSKGRITYLHGTIMFGNVDGKNYLIFTDVRNKKVVIELMSDELKRLEDLYDN